MSRQSADLHSPNDLSRDEAYRRYLINCNQAPIVYHSGPVAFKRLRADFRRSWRGFKSAVAALRIALIACKIRRVQQELVLQRIGTKRPIDRRP